MDFLEGFFLQWLTLMFVYLFIPPLAGPVDSIHTLLLFYRGPAFMFWTLAGLSVLFHCSLLDMEAFSVGLDSHNIGGRWDVFIKMQLTDQFNSMKHEV